MTNDEFQMTNQIRIPNSERKPLAADGSFSHSSFVILSTFVIRVSSFSRSRLRRLLHNYE